MASLDLTFKAVRETTNTVRFEEETAPGQKPKVGAIYVQKSTLDGWDYPEVLSVVVTPKKA